MRNKRFLASLLSAAMMLGTVSAPAFAAEGEPQTPGVTETAVTNLGTVIETTNEGGEINLAEGETVVLPDQIKKSVSIIGATDAEGNPASTVVFDYTGAKDNTAFTMIVGDNITLKNINFIVKKSEVNTDHNAKKRFFWQTTGENFTLENCCFTATGTNAIALCLCNSAVIRDCDFVGGFKQIGDGEIKDDVLIENCSFSQTTYGIHFGTVNGHTVTVRNCDLNGTWNSFGKGSGEGVIVIEGSRFNAVDGGFNYLFPHTNMTVSDSVFSAGFGIGENDPNAVVEFNNCTVDGGGKLKDLFDGDSEIFKAVVAIDAVKDADGKYVSGTFVGDEQKIKDKCLYDIKANEDGSYAVDIVAKAGGKYYTDLQSAIDDAANDETIVLQSSFTADFLGGYKEDGKTKIVSTFEVPKDKKIVLDLNGKTINWNIVNAQDKNRAVSMFAVKGDLTLTDSTAGGILSTMDTNYGSVISVRAQGKLTVNGGTLNGKLYGIVGNGSDVTAPGTDVVINGGEINGRFGIYHPQAGTLTVNESAVINGTNGSGIEMRAGNLNVNGGTITGDYTCDADYPEDNIYKDSKFFVQASSSGPTVYGAGIAVSQHSTRKEINVNIKGGTITGFNAVYENIFGEPGKDVTVEEPVTLNIEGGEFKTTAPVTDSDRLYPGAGKAVYSANEKEFISGGVFSSDVTEYAAEGTSFADNGSGSYTKRIAAKVGEKEYTGITEALKEAENGAKVTVLAGTYDEEVKVPFKNVTIQGEGEVKLTGGIVFTGEGSGADIAIKDLNIDTKGIMTDKHTDGSKIDSLTVTGCKFTNISGQGTSASAIFIKNGGALKNLTVTDNTFDNSEIGCIYSVVTDKITITGNTFDNNQYNIIWLSGKKQAVKVNINGNVFNDWGLSRKDSNGNPEGRAMRLNDFADASVLDMKKNVFSCANPPEEYIKASGIASGCAVDLNDCYWSGGEPASGIGKGKHVYIYNTDKEVAETSDIITYYADKAMTESVNIAAAQVDDVYYADLQTAIDAAEPGDTVKLVKDIVIKKTIHAPYVKWSVLVEKSLTIDGQGHTVESDTDDTGKNFRGEILLLGGDTPADTRNVTVKNLTVKTDSYNARGIQTGGGYINLTLDGVTIDATEGTGLTQPLTIWGEQPDTTEIIIKNSKISSSKKGYAVIVFTQVKMSIENSSIDGWASLYMKDTYPGGTGSKGSVVDVKNSALKGTNYQTSGVNNFGVIVIEDDEVEINVTDSKLIAVAENPMNEKIISFSYHPPYSETNENFAKDSKVTVGGNSTIELIGENAIFMNSLDESNAVTVTGGRFNAEPEADVLAEGYTTYESDGYYYVVTDFTMKANADKTELKAGEEVVVTVAATGASYTNADWKLRYDPTKLTLVSAEKGRADEISEDNFVLSGKVVNAGNETKKDEIASGEVLATYTFKAVAQTKASVTTAVEFIDAHVNTYDMAILLTNVPAKTEKADVTIVIDAEASIPGMLEKQTVVYDGKAHMSNPFVSTESGVVVTYSTEENGTYSTALPTFTKVGSYDVWYKAELAGYNTKAARAAGAVVIEPKAVTAGVEFAAGAAYPEVVIRPTVNGVVDRSYTGTVTVAIDGKTYSFKAEDFVFVNGMAVLAADKARTIELTKGGKFEVTASYSAGTDDNYKGGEETTTNVNVDLAFADEAATNALKAAVKSEFVYNGAEHGVDVANNLPDGWEVGSITAIDNTPNPKVTNVADGSVFVRVVFTDSKGRYNDVTVNTVLAITPAEATITVGTFAKAYGTADDTITVKDGGKDAAVTGLVNAVDLGTVAAVRAELGEDRGTYAMTASYTPNPNYNVTVVNGKLEIGAPEYLVEVVNNSLTNPGTAIKPDYVAGYRLILVYTDADRSYFTYGARTLFDVTERGYEYVDDKGVASDKDYRHVFGIVVKADGNAPAGDYRAKVNYTTDAAAKPERIVYDMDINLDGAYSVNDISSANGVYNALYEDVYAKNMLKADANGNKMVDTDDVNLVKGKVGR